MKRFVVSKIVFLLLFVDILIAKKEEIIDGGLLKTCPRPRAPSNAVISYLQAPRSFPGDSTSNGGYGVDEYYEHDIVYFHCRDGFKQTATPTMYITCGSNGKWFPDIKNLGKCIKLTTIERCNARGLFRCKKSRECISQKKRCDCTPDCEDGSDELGCSVRRKFIRAPTAGRDASGIITSPGYPRQYPGNFTCIYHISTFGQSHIEIDFDEFDLPERVGRKCVDFVRIVGLHSKSITKQKKKKKRKLLSETKCGKDKFKRVFSQHMYITVNVSIGHDAKEHRGFAFKWKIRNSVYVQKYNDKIPTTDVNKTEKNSSDTTYAIILPIAVSALIPLLLIIFLCSHRHLRRRCSKTNKNKHATQNEGGNSDDSSQNSQQTLMLTENNLALFENQQYLANAENPGEKQNNVIYSESDEFSRRNNVNSAITCDCKCCVRNRQLNSNIELNEKINRDSYDSNESDVPRYVMSYDVAIRQSMSKEYQKNRSPCITPDPLIHSSRMIRPYSNSSPHLSHSSRGGTKHSKASRDNIRHTSHDQNLLNSYSSQSSSSCKLCSHNKRNNKSDWNFNNNTKSSRDSLRHTSRDTFNTIKHNIIVDNIDHRIEQVSEVSTLQEENVENIDEYPHQVSEYPDEEEYPSTEELAYSVHPFYNDRANYTSFYDNTHNNILSSPSHLSASLDVYNAFHGQKILNNEDPMRLKGGSHNTLWTYR